MFYRGFRDVLQYRIVLFSPAPCKENIEKENYFIFSSPNPPHQGRAFIERALFSRHSSSIHINLPLLALPCWGGLGGENFN